MADLRSAIVLPWLGAPAPPGTGDADSPCGCSGGCGGGCGCEGGCGGNGGCGCEGGGNPPQPALGNLPPPDSATESGWDSRVGSTCSGGEPLGQAVALVKRLRSQVYEPLRPLESLAWLATCDGRVDVRATRDLILQFQVPAAAPGDPQPLVTYTPLSASFPPG